MSSLGLIGAAVAAAIAGMPAQAQNAAPVSEEIEEVLVTARRFSETFRDVPMTVNVFTSETIEAAGIDRPADFIARVPNMTLVETQNAGNAFVVIRGISQARNSEPSVAVLVDGVLETNPAEFNQELFDIEQIEVLKGPQGAVYGRNAIGGAIIIQTKEPGDEFEGRVKLGYGNENSMRAQAGISGPLGDTFGYRASVSYYDTDGFLPSTFLGGKADPVESLSARLRLDFDPSETFSGDVRLSYENLDTRGFYFVIPRDDEANPFATFTTPPNANDVTSPIQVDQTGIDERDLLTGALRLNFELGGGTLTSVSAYNSTEEIITGDAYDFRPAANSIFNVLLGTDLNQSQFLDLESWSQEIRFTSSDEGRVRWILGGYFVHTDRFISTGNMVDDGTGVFPVYHEPRPSRKTIRAPRSWPTRRTTMPGRCSVTWSSNSTTSSSSTWPCDTTRTSARTPPTHRRPSCRIRPPPPARCAPKRSARPSPNSRCATSPTRTSPSLAAGAAASAAVVSTRRAWARWPMPAASPASTTSSRPKSPTPGKSGFKGQFLDRRLNVGVSVFDTESTNGYFFVFLAANSTQNLGNLDADYQGAEFEISGKVTDNLELFGSYGYTDSEITGMEDPSVIGNQAPLVSDVTYNLGAQWRQPLGDSLALALRADYRHVGETWWEPYNVTSRDPIDIVDLRLGLEGEKWAVTAWSQNLTDEEYNAEFSPGGFLFRALPLRYGVEFSYSLLIRSR